MDAADDVVAAAAGAVVVPFAVDEAAGDGDRAAFGEVFRAGVGLGAEGGDVDEHRRLVLLVVDGDPQLADLAVFVKRAVTRSATLGVGNPPVSRMGRKMCP